jgi:predicted GIY-YIG superfamily endonuclease
LDACLPAGGAAAVCYDFVYVIKAVNHFRFYVGCEFVEKRIKEHNSGKRNPLKVINLGFLFSLRNIKLEMKLEKWLKSGVGKEFIKKYRIP